MPIYEYRCRNGHAFEVFQSMSDDPVAVCEECEAPVERVFHPVAVHFKGSGFYTTDYAKQKAGPAADGSSKEKSDSGKGSESKAAKDTGGSSGDSGKSGGSSGD